MVRKATLTLLAVALAVPAWTQVQTGRIVGTVRDPQQATVAKAAVTVTAAGHRPVSHRRPRTSRGDYVVTPVDPGRYEVTVVGQGFQTAVVTAVEVPVGQSVRVDVELKLGARNETTEVTASAPLLDTESGSLGQNITNTQIANLPLNGRSFYELARLTPGAAGLPGGGNLVRIRANFISGTAISGVRGSQLTFQIDGVDVTDHHQGGSYIQTSIDALQEFKVQQSAYSAEFSQAGGMLNAATKSGTQRVPWRAVRVPAQRRLRRHRLLREAQAAARPASVRRHARRPPREGPDVLLPELRGHPREAGPARQPDRPLRRHEARATSARCATASTTRSPASRSRATSSPPTGSPRRRNTSRSSSPIPTWARATSPGPRSAH